MNTKMRYFARSAGRSVKVMQQDSLRKDSWCWGGAACLEVEVVVDTLAALTGGMWKRLSG